ncbi:hypothetical protein LAD77_02010 [Klebsiella pneumoniae]|nr:hypothetical protein [Klebsiella pneumoniae]
MNAPEKNYQGIIIARPLRYLDRSYSLAIVLLGVSAQTGSPGAWPRSTKPPATSLYVLMTA